MWIYYLHVSDETLRHREICSTAQLVSGSAVIQAEAFCL